MLVRDDDYLVGGSKLPAFEYKGWHEMVIAVLLLTATI